MPEGESLESITAHQRICRLLTVSQCWSGSSILSENLCYRSLSVALFVGGFPIRQADRRTLDIVPADVRDRL